MAKLSQEDKADIVRRIGKGEAYAVIAQDFKVSEQTCRNVVAKDGKLGKPGKSPLAKHKEPGPVSHMTRKKAHDAELKAAAADLAEAAGESPEDSDPVLMAARSAAAKAAVTKHIGPSNFKQGGLGMVATGRIECASRDTIPAVIARKMDFYKSIGRGYEVLYEKIKDCTCEEEIALNALFDKLRIWEQ